MTRFIETTTFCGGSFQIAIQCSFKTLSLLFGEPSDPSRISYNSRFEWNVKDIDSNSCCRIYEWISKGVRTEDYPRVDDIRIGSWYKWNIGANDMTSAMLLLDWLRSRDPSVTRVSDWADPIPFATERKKYLMNNFTITELRDTINSFNLDARFRGNDKRRIDISSNATKEQIVDAIVKAETRKQCDLS